MLWRLETTSERTFADQIASQVRHGVASADLSPGDRLPSARELAAMLDINLHTVLRAYQVLRDEGVIELRRGRGATIAPGAAVSGVHLAERAAELVREVHRTGGSRDDALEAVATAWRTTTGAPTDASTTPDRPSTTTVGNA